MKKITQIFLLLLLSLSFGLPCINVFAAESEHVPSANNINVGQGSNYNNKNNEYLNLISGSEDIKAGTKGEKSVKELLITMAKDLKTVMYLVAGLYFLIITIRLVFSSNTEEGVTKFKNGIIWITIGIVVMQIAYYFVGVLYDQEVGGALASNFTKNVITPLIKVLETASSFFFILIAIYAFYRMITANGDDEKAKQGKMTIAYALIGFVVIKLSKEIVYSIYGQVDCKEGGPGGIFQFAGSKCIADNDLTGVVKIVADIINWMNGFVGILVLIIIIYAGLQVFFSNGDEEKLSKAKRSVLYVAIGIGILVMNYLILTFFILPEVAI